MSDRTTVESRPFRVTRIQANVIARSERKLLTWLCARLPAWVTPDGLTALSVAGAVLIFASDIVSRWAPLALWVSSVGLLVNWFGDSLDGSLARFRHIERPQYGYFLDHTVDALCNLLIMTGLGFTLGVRMDVSLLALIGYYLLCMYVFINNHVSGVMQLSFLGFGPTELRICLVAINLAMYFFGPVGIRLGLQVFSVYDGLLLFAAAIFLLLFLKNIAVGAARLRRLPSGSAL